MKRIITIHRNLAEADPATEWVYSTPLGFNPTKVNIKWVAYSATALAAGDIIAITSPIVNSYNGIMLTFSDQDSQFDPGLVFDCNYSGVIPFNVMAVSSKLSPMSSTNLGTLSMMLEFSE